MRRLPHLNNWPSFPLSLPVLPAPTSKSNATTLQGQIPLVTAALLANEEEPLTMAAIAKLQGGHNFLAITAWMPPPGPGVQAGSGRARLVVFIHAILVRESSETLYMYSLKGFWGKPHHQSINVPSGEKGKSRFPGVRHATNQTRSLRGVLSWTKILNFPLPPPQPPLSASLQFSEKFPENLSTTYKP